MAVPGSTAIEGEDSRFDMLAEGGPMTEDHGGFAASPPGNLKPGQTPGRSVLWVTFEATGLAFDAAGAEIGENLEGLPRLEQVYRRGLAAA